MATKFTKMHSLSCEYLQDWSAEGTAGNLADSKVIKGQETPSSQTVSCFGLTSTAVCFLWLRYWQSSSSSFVYYINLIKDQKFQQFKERKHDLLILILINNKKGNWALVSLLLEGLCSVLFHKAPTSDLISFVPFTFQMLTPPILIIIALLCRTYCKSVSTSSPIFISFVT